MADLGFINDLWFDRREELDGDMRLVDFIKASFGGDRSEAGRYAANIRWQGRGGRILKLNDPLSQKFLDETYDSAKSYAELNEKIRKRLPIEVVREAFVFFGYYLGTDKLHQWLVENAEEKGKEPPSDWRQKEPSEMLGDIIHQVLGQWRGFVDDSPFMPFDRPVLRAFQVAVQQNFGLSAAEGNPADKGDKEWYEAASKLLANPAFVTVLKTLAQVVYEENQEILKKANFTHIEIERGTKNDRLAEEIETNGKATVMLRPVSSWSLDSSTADMFAKPNDHQRRKFRGVILKAEVPIEKVFSFGGYSFGKKEENEVTILGGPIEVTGRIHGGDNEKVLKEIQDNKLFFIDDEEADWLKEVRLMRLMGLIKASFGGDRSEAGRYAANVRWQGHTKEQKVIGFIGKSRYKVGADGSKHPEALKKEINEESAKIAKSQKVGTGFQERASQSKAMVCKNISEQMSNITTDEIKFAYGEIMFGTTDRKTLNDLLNPDFDREAWVSQLVASWATTSNDGEDLSLAIQDTAAKLFGLDKALSWTKTSSMEGEIKETKNYQPSVKDLSPATQKVLEAFVQAQYDATQQYFAEKNIQYLTVYRGMKFEDKNEMSRAGFDDLDDEKVTKDSLIVRQRPLSSWSLDTKTGVEFSFYQEFKPGGVKYISANGVLMKTRVPVSEIFSIPLTGVGCLGEYEVVLLSPLKTIMYQGGRDIDFIHFPIGESFSVSARVDLWANDKQQGERP